MNQSNTPSQGVPSSAAKPIEICSLRIGNMIFGMPISHIVEIINSVCPQPVPLAPGFVGGLVHYRGDVLATVGLRNILGMPALERPQPILVLDSPRGYFGLLVDSVGEVLSVLPRDFEPNPSMLDQKLKTIFAGAYKLADCLVVILDPTRLDSLHLVAAENA
jgi:purine-binding chemotaxis protein CheW